MCQKIKYYWIIDDSGYLSPVRMKCIQSVQLSADNWEEVVVKKSNDMATMIMTVDKKKFEIAYDDPNACIIDTDCFVAKTLHEMELEENIPYFARYEYNRDFESPDLFYFYVNGRCDYFKENFPQTLFTNDKYSVTPEFLKGLKDFKYIPEMSYVHFYSSMSKFSLINEKNALLNTLKKVTERYNYLAQGVDQLSKFIRMGNK